MVCLCNCLLLISGIIIALCKGADSPQPPLHVFCYQASVLNVHLHEMNPFSKLLEEKDTGHF